MGIGRGVHPRSPQRFFSEKEASGVGSSPDDRVRRAPPLSRRRRSAEILRFHLPQVPPVPYQDGSLTLAVTHKFPRGGLLSRPAQASHALRPAELLTHHTWALSRGFALASFPARALASYQVQPTTSLGGSFPHW